MKYIPADKLIAEIEFAKSVYDNPKRVIHGVADAFRQDGRAAMCDDILKKIASLQQEPRFPQYDNIVEKVFGAGNLEGWERDEAEMLVALAKEELLKSLQQEQPETDLLEESYMRGFAQGAKEERERMLEDIAKLIDTADKCGLNFGAECGFQIALDELEQRLTGKH